MAHVPRGFCSECAVELKLDRIGVSLLACVPSKAEYYKVSADRWRCPVCMHTTYLGFGRPVESFEPGYKNLQTEVAVELL